jgi:putative NADH-flavin reductase
MTTIALFGGTGRTGRRVRDRALAAGMEVRLLARNPAAVGAPRDRLTVIGGDVLDSVAVGEALSSADAVISVFGQVKGSPPTLQTDGTRVIVEGMQRLGIRRIVTLSGGGLHDPHDRPKGADRIITLLLRTFAAKVLADAEGHLHVLRHSDLDWTVVRGPRLTEGPGVGNYRVGWVGVGTGTQISRDDLADFIITQVDDRQFLRALPFVSA